MNCTKLVRGLACAVTILSLSVGVSMAQRQLDASLRVKVSDPTGALVSNAQVTLLLADRGPRTAQTNQRGETQFTRITTGSAKLHINAPGFKPRDIEGVELRSGNNEVSVQLEISEIKADVEVKRDEVENSSDPNGPAFTNVLTEDQIKNLPDDPEEFERAIQALAGPDAQIRVNGFRGGRLPPKSQIREIRFRMNPYAPENHDAGHGFVDIVTKPGMDNWHGSFNFGFRDEALQGRQALARFRGPEQMRRFGVSLDGPLWKNQTSIFFNADGSLFYDAKTIVAALPTGPFSDLAFRPSRRLNFSTRVEHAASKTQTMRFEYQRNASLQNNLGVGDFDLAGRAFSVDSAEHLFRFANSGVVLKRYLNELRFQARWQNIDTQSSNDELAINVLNAFNSGGAQRNGNRRAREIELADNFDVGYEKHSIRVGFQLNSGSYRSSESNNATGTFTFPSIDAYLAGRPTTFSRRVGDPLVNYTMNQFGSYWQDDWRARKNLTLSFGVRYEFQTHLPDRVNFAPRFGLAWSPKKDGSMTVRAGGGIFQDWFAASTLEQTLRVDGVRQRDLIVQNPGFPNPFSGGTQVTLPTSRMQADPSLTLPYIIQGSVGVESRPLNLIRLMTNYQFQRGVHLLRGRNINAPVAGARPDPAFGNITQVESSATSWVHRMLIGVGPGQIKPNQLFWSVNYLMTKSTNDGDGAFSLPADNLNLRGERGPAANDIRHMVSGFLSKRLPKNFSWSSFFTIASAPPYNITTGFDNNGDSVSNDRPAGVRRNSARGDGRIDISTRLGWTLNFGKAQQQNAGGAPRVMMVRVGEGGGGGVSMSGPGTKQFQLELYTQVSNITNSTNLVGFSGVQASPFFGRATSSMAPRRIEMGMRFSF